MLAWVPPFQAQILEARAEELRVRKLRLWLTKMAAALDYSLGTIVTLATLGYFVTQGGGTLKASVALPVLGLVNRMVGPFGSIPQWINQYLVWRSAYERANRFIGLQCQQAAAHGDLLSGKACYEVCDPSTGVVALKNCTFAWPREPTRSSEVGCSSKSQGFRLTEISFTLSAHQTLVVVGQEGQGKSSLLLALLGEMPLESGHYWGPPGHKVGLEVLLPSSKARATLCESTSSTGNGARAVVPYAAQEGLIFSGTVRSNIVFGTRYDSRIFKKVVSACALEEDFFTMPAQDLTEVTSSGTTLSGGQRARVGLARAVYCALVHFEDTAEPPLVLLDDPFSALDSNVAEHVSRALLTPATGLLASCGVVVAAADPWWLRCLRAEDEFVPNLRIAVLHEQRLIFAGEGEEGQTPWAEDRPQEYIETFEEPVLVGLHGEDAEQSAQDDATLTVPAELQKAATVVVDEERQSGRVRLATYASYLKAVGPCILSVLALALTGIMFFQNLCNLWLAYWTSQDLSGTFLSAWVKSAWLDHPPSEQSQLWAVYAVLVLGFTVSNFAGHALEIVGGIRAARRIFAEALQGALTKPFSWWDANPTGRVLNRFSGDVDVMDAAVTNIMGVIFGAVLFFVGHTIVLAAATPFCLLLLPFVALCMEYFARYYRVTIREVQRLMLVSMSQVYQEMTQVIQGRVTIRAYGAAQQALTDSLESLDSLQRVSFIKTVVMKWVGLRMWLAGFIVSTFSQLYPVLQYFHIFKPQSAALVGFSISYSSELVGIIQQFVMNFSDLEMQLVSIERLREYAASRPQSLSWKQPTTLTLPTSTCAVDEMPTLLTSPKSCAVRSSQTPAKGGQALGLRVTGLELTYRQGLRPALRGVSLQLGQGEVAVLMGRTGAGKSSLLLAILQLVPYSGLIEVDGQDLRSIAPEEVRQKLVAVVPQQPMIFDGDLRWNLDPAKECTAPELCRALSAAGFGCAAAGECTPDSGQKDRKEGLDTPLKSSLGRSTILSQGQRQLLCAARALLRRPRVAVLDEVTAALPHEAAIATAARLLSSFKDQGASVLMVSHQPELAEAADHVLTMAHGQLSPQPQELPLAKSTKTAL